MSQISPKSDMSAKEKAQIAFVEYIKTSGTSSTKMAILILEQSYSSAEIDELLLTIVKGLPILLSTPEYIINQTEASNIETNYPVVADTEVNKKPTVIKESWLELQKSFENKQALLQECILKNAAAFEGSNKTAHLIFHT